MFDREVTERRMAIVFNEWVKRYAESPSEWGQILKPDGTPFEDYGEQATAYFFKLAAELDSSGALPLPETQPSPLPTAG